MKNKKIHTALSALLLAVIFGGCSSSPSGSEESFPVPSIPEIPQWESSTIPETSASSKPESSTVSSIPEISEESSKESSEESSKESSVEPSQEPSEPIQESSVTEVSKQESSNPKPEPESSVEESSIEESFAEESDITSENSNPNDPDTYFKDAAFLGNSLISGLDIYNIEPDADYYWSIGMSVYGALHTPMKDSEYTAVETLCDKTFGKVFLMFGTNELGWTNSDSFISYYSDIIDEIHTSMPNAKIYIQSILPVTKSVSIKNENGINNKRIEEYNNLLKKLAVGKNVNYLDIASIYKDKDGNMKDEFSGGDGIHISPNAYYKWIDYILKNA